METIAVNEVKNLFPWFMKYENVWSSYDKEADTLYLHFKKTNHADYSEMTEDDIIIRYEQGEIIGFTILNLSTR